jgi:ABC-2 type transport system ATP-binding protein
VQPVISVSDLTKTYASGFHALKKINLEIRPGEIFALLGPNGAGKTTLISIICGIVNPTRGVVMADGHDVISDYRAARSKIGLVPQELSTDSFETVWARIARFDPKARGIVCAFKRENVIGARDQRTTSGPTGIMTRINRPKT